MESVSIGTRTGVMPGLKLMLSSVIGSLFEESPLESLKREIFIFENFSRHPGRLAWEVEFRLNEMPR